ncbi:MAG: hypothetical protein K0U23_04660 [Gammaproteobacteria bacterium]|nr:hypothetical protein [Gammaproteobacteria bacterium]
MYTDDIIGLVGLILILWTYLPVPIHQIRYKQTTSHSKIDLILKIIGSIAGAIYGLSNSVPLLVILCIVGIAINALLLIRKST